MKYTSRLFKRIQLVATSNQPRRRANQLARRRDRAAFAGREHKTIMSGDKRFQSKSLNVFRIEISMSQDANRVGRFDPASQLSANASRKCIGNQHLRVDARQQIANFPASTLLAAVRVQNVNGRSASLRTLVCSQLRIQESRPSIGAVGHEMQIELRRGSLKRASQSEGAS